MAMNRNLVMLIAVVSGLFILLFMSLGCGESSSNDTPAKINLMIDKNNDGLPDQLVDAVNDALDVAEESGDPDSIDSPEEEAAFREALVILLEKMPFSNETVSRQQEINDIYEQIADPEIDIERIDALLDQIEQDLEEMRQDDMSYNIVQDAVSTMLEPQQGSFESVSGEAGGSNRPDYDSMKKGDILFGRSSGITSQLPYVIDFTHAGNYQGNSFVYEAISDGVVLRPLSVWKTDYGRVALGRSNRRTIPQITDALDWAIIRYGTASMSGYNWSVFTPHDKKTDDICLKPPYQKRCLYCSQLTWKIHDYAGVNVDSNNVKYIAQVALSYGCISPAAAAYLMSIIIPGVMPDEIFRDKNINVYSDGSNAGIIILNPPKDVFRVNNKMERESEFYNPSEDNHVYVNGASAPKSEPLDYFAALYYYDKNNQRHVGIEGKWYPTALISFPPKPEWFENSTSFEVMVKTRLKRDYASVSSEYVRKFPRMR
jgi:uncharacterized protein YycO